MRFWGFLVFFTSISFGISARDGLDFPPAITIQQIEETLSSPNGPKNVEEFLASLPKNYREYFVLQYESASLHQASPQYPRIILFGPDAKLLTGISGDPTDPNYHMVEMIEYDSLEGKFHFYRTDFSKEIRLR